MPGWVSVCRNSKPGKGLPTTRSVGGWGPRAMGAVPWPRVPKVCMLQRHRAPVQTLRGLLIVDASSDGSLKTGRSKTGALDTREALAPAWGKLLNLNSCAAELAESDQRTAAGRGAPCLAYCTTTGLSMAVVLRLATAGFHSVRYCGNKITSRRVSRVRGMARNERSPSPNCLWTASSGSSLDVSRR